MAGILKMYDKLKLEYDNALSELDKVDKDLKKLNGRKARDAQSASNRKPSSIRSKISERLDNNNRTSRLQSKIEQAHKRKHRESSSDKSQESITDDGGGVTSASNNSKKPALSSSIGNVALPDIKTKQEKESDDQKFNQHEPDEGIKAAAQPDRISMARNRRMFGFMLGTLKKFQCEESQRKDTTTKREKIEQRLEREAAVEKEEVQKEKQHLQKSVRSKQAELRKIELKIERVKIHQGWEKSIQNIGNFIQTKTKPAIFYSPVKHTPETEKRIKETKDKYKIILAERRAKVQKEMQEIDEMYTRDDELKPESNRTERSPKIADSGRRSTSSRIDSDQRLNGSTGHHTNSLGSVVVVVKEDCKSSAHEAVPAKIDSNCSKQENDEQQITSNNHDHHSKGPTNSSSNEHEQNNHQSHQSYRQQSSAEHNLNDGQSSNLMSSTTEHESTIRSDMEADANNAKLNKRSESKQQSSIDDADEPIMQADDGEVDGEVGQLVKSAKMANDSLEDREFEPIYDE